MAERKTVYKWFWVWNFEKEEQWLNEMAMNGWVLVGVGWGRYTFERCEPGEYCGRLEMHGADTAYIDFMQEMGATYIGRVLQWLYFCKKTEDGAFDIFSDIDSRIAHLDRIAKLLLAIGLGNLLIGLANAGVGNGVGVVNLLVVAVLMYGLGRIHGKKEEMEKERRLHE